MLRIAPFALLAAFCCGAQAATITFDPVPPQQLTLMTAAEQEAHRKALLKLVGAEREAYRNQVYQDLRVRARNQGYMLPEVPPWGLTDDAEPPAPPPMAKAPGAEEIKATIDAHRKQMDADRKAADRDFRAQEQAFKDRQDRIQAVLEKQRKEMRARMEAALDDEPQPPRFRPAPPPPPPAATYPAPPVYYPYPPRWPAPYYGPRGY